MTARLTKRLRLYLLRRNGLAYKRERHHSCSSWRFGGNSPVVILLLTVAPFLASHSFSRQTSSCQNSLHQLMFISHRLARETIQTRELLLEGRFTVVVSSELLRMLCRSRGYYMGFILLLDDTMQSFILPKRKRH